MNDPLYPRRDQRTSQRLRGACLALLWLLAGVAGAETRAWLDRSQVREGETVTLNIQTDQPGVAPDYAPLQADFEVSAWR